MDYLEDEYIPRNVQSSKTEQWIENLYRTITNNEIKEKQIPNRKSAGPVCCTSKFYQIFKEELISI